MQQHSIEVEQRHLDELEIAENTIVIFMSDNGGLSTHTKMRPLPTCNVPLRAGKGWLYEGGIREPMLIKWPGVVKPGSKSAEPVIAVDLYPTFCEMAGVELPTDQPVDRLLIADRCVCKNPRPDFVGGLAATAKAEHQRND